MEAYTQNFLEQQQQNKGLMMNNMSPQLPPPVAMSLRARETASMALKHIFDQRMSNVVSSREQECKSAQGNQMGGFQGTKNQSMPNLRKRVPELDLSFRKAQDSNFANAQTGFGSPISTPTPSPSSSNQDLMSQFPLPSNSQLMQHNHTSPAVFSARLTPSSRQPTAQMTVFYSGSVNVYDDVPADKAHAIMLLAGNSWSTNFRSPVGMAGPVSSGCTEVMAKERAVSPLRGVVSQQEAPSPTANTSARNGPNSASAVPAVLSVASPPPSPAPISLADGATTMQAGAPARRPHVGIELPHARKASLARFLEKRKDRVVQLNSDQQGADGGEKGGRDGGESASCSGKPHDEFTATNPSNSKKPCIRSCSTSPSQSTSNISSKDNIGTSTKERSVQEEFLAQKAINNEHSFFHERTNQR
ncbi:hypothetical protein L7F22_066777 [Adiantum nelumboides]|nr:hypothetical protein [Adiantum nelumboides]